MVPSGRLLEGSSNNAAGNTDPLPPNPPGLRQGGITFPVSQSWQNKSERKMKRIKVSTVYYVKGSTEDKRCADRLERMLRFIDADSVKAATLEELDSMAAQLGQDSGGPLHPYLFFGRFQRRIGAEEHQLSQKYPHLQGGLQRIWGAHQISPTGNLAGVAEGCICRPIWTTDPIQGCFHRCTYCFFSNLRYLCMTLNVEDLVERIQEVMKLVPWQKNWHTGGASDIFCFEPEYGYTQQLLDIAAEEDRNVLFYTSTDNVDFLGGLTNRDRAVIEWTISPHGLVKWERKAPSLAARLQAMQKCKAAGCTVRCQFAPFVPLTNWRDEYREMLGELFSAVEPDLIAMHMVRWCPHPVSQTLRDWFGQTGVDPEYMGLVEEAERNGGQASFPGGHVFPASGREKLYRFMIDEIRKLNPDIPIVLCRETPEMWKHFKDELRTDPAMCGCGTLPRA